MALEAVRLLGCGPSTGVPQIHHILEGECSVCTEALRKPESCPNKRNNVSLTLSLRDPEGVLRHVQVDMGKTFRDSAMRWYPKFGISAIDAVLLTHPHADAVDGLDDLRDVQPRPPREQRAREGLLSADGAFAPYAAQQRVPLVLSQHCLEQLRRSHPYIVDSPDLVDRKVSAVLPQLFHQLAGAAPHHDALAGRTFPLFGLSVTLLPCFHGGDYVSYGFAFADEKVKVVYLSDVSSFPAATLRAIDELGRIDVLVIDCLFEAVAHFSHLSLHEVAYYVDRWRPAVTYTVGMSCRLTYARLKKRLEALAGDINAGEGARWWQGQPRVPAGTAAPAAAAGVVRILPGRDGLSILPQNVLAT